MTGRIVGPTENDILLARRLQRKGASLQEIHDAVCGYASTKTDAVPTMAIIPPHARICMTSKGAAKPKRREGVYIRFGEAVAYYRLHRFEGTQQMLANKVGKTRAAIASIELGRQRVYLGDVLLFAKAFDIDPSVLVRAAMEGGK